MEAERRGLPVRFLRLARPGHEGVGALRKADAILRVNQPLPTYVTWEDLVKERGREREKKDTGEWKVPFLQSPPSTTTTGSSLTALSLHNG